jgi:hypothetical protein
VDAAGDPVALAAVRVVRVDGRELGSLLLLSTRTNAEGWFDSAGLPTGRLGIEILHEGGMVLLEVDSPPILEEWVLPGP